MEHPSLVAAVHSKSGRGSAVVDTTLQLLDLYINVLQLDYNFKWFSLTNWYADKGVKGAIVALDCESAPPF